MGLNPPAEVAARYPTSSPAGSASAWRLPAPWPSNPEIILADEPISMLDVSIRMGVLNLMERLKEERGIGYLYITHDIASARYIGDETMVMYAGHMVEGAESEELMHNPAHPYTSCCSRRCRIRMPGSSAHSRGPRGSAVAGRTRRPAVPLPPAARM